jgi:hypothetical protein
MNKNNKPIKLKEKSRQNACLRRTGGGLFRMGRLVGFFLLLTLCVFGLLFYGMMNTSTELATLRTDFATLNAQSVKIKAELLGFYVLFKI